MKCHVCGGEMLAEDSDMPFKVSRHKVVIFKDLPVLQCRECGEYLLEDRVMAHVEVLLAKSAPEAELDVMRYAA